MQKNKSTTLKTLCFCAMLTALSSVIAYFCKMFFTITPTFRITFENLPLILSGWFFGPIWGFVTGICSDLLSTAVSQYGLGGINPIITLGAGFVGLISGIFSFISKKTNNNKSCLFLGVFISHVVSNIIIKSLGMIIFYKYNIVVLLPRIPLYIIISLLEFSVCFFIVNSKGIQKAIKLTETRKTVKK